MTDKNSFMHRPVAAAMMAGGLAFAILTAGGAGAAEAPAPEKTPEMPACSATDTACLMPALEALTAAVTETSWRDQTYREIAKLYMAKGDAARALAILPRIESPDTKALTIRGIGMAAAHRDMSPDDLRALFTALRAEADKIAHPPSHGIALTYIAMAQAFAKDDAGAFATAKSMTNGALRHKAFGESAEIQAERGDLKPALESLAAIDSESFRNKAHLTVARIFADKGQYDHAMATAAKITNSYQRSQAVLYLLAKQITPEEVTLGIKE
ncbi:MAG: hypothetical protein HYU57_07310 [Micavibrio aeruginosavorus]|nr:hypothetical protein [Micavibrio aeruginosavorus]